MKIKVLQNCVCSNVDLVAGKEYEVDGKIITQLDAKKLIAYKLVTQVLEPKEDEPKADEPKEDEPKKGKSKNK